MVPHLYSQQLENNQIIISMQGAKVLRWALRKFCPYRSARNSASLWSHLSSCWNWAWWYAPWCLKSISANFAPCRIWTHWKGISNLEIPYTFWRSSFSVWCFCATNVMNENFTSQQNLLCSSVDNISWVHVWTLQHLALIFPFITTC